MNVTLQLMMQLGVFFRCEYTIFSCPVLFHIILMMMSH